MSASLGGFASSLVGIGCAACGTFVLGPLIAIAGTGSIIAALPLGGGEFIALGICLLAVSLWLQARAAGLPVACATPIPGKVFPQKEDK